MNRVSLDLKLRRNIELVNTTREILNNKTFTRQELVRKFKKSGILYYSVLPIILLDHGYIKPVSTIRKSRRLIPVYKFCEKPVHYEVYNDVSKYIEN